MTMSVTVHHMLDELVEQVRRVEPNVGAEGLSRVVKAAGERLSLSSAEVAEYLSAMDAKARDLIRAPAQRK